jgi:hypothetical protein
MMEAVNTSEMAVNFCKTTRHIFPEDNNLHIRRHENLKSYFRSSVSCHQTRRRFCPCGDGNADEKEDDTDTSRQHCELKNSACVLLNIKCTRRPIWGKYSVLLQVMPSHASFRTSCVCLNHS